MTLLRNESIASLLPVDGTFLILSYNAVKNNQKKKKRKKEKRTEKNTFITAVCSKIGWMTVDIAMINIHRSEEGFNC